ncbi:hypothetical protein BOX15_Mlig032203g1 [Macrostomum lignano]|uniref:Alpha-1,3-glucosyltransferase n=1 Tax=Macrostomum lignano TaxID=282301 RepID=A0A267G3E1_9PLAT|nr:hypothetical protein BOX15_Mlig032203g1 [Macrostomum lignano]
MAKNASGFHTDVILVAAGLTFLKLLFSQLYYSTDFEVHRNWLAITHSLPLSKWYSENTSQWTLDYPPYFAYFEWSLSQLAALVDPGMLNVSNLNYASGATVMFQRVSVIVSDAALFAACLAIVSDVGGAASKSATRGGRGGVGAPALWTALLLLCNFGLLIVDHIHFQYNGMLTGLLIGSLLCIRRGQAKAGALLFAALLNFKHIYLYCAPALFVYLLRHYCIGRFSTGHLAVKLPAIGGSLSVARLASLGGIVLAVLATSLAPFAYHIPQLLSRLFPFKRGLCHAYWAPNFWTLYNCLDKLLEIVGCRLGLLTKQPGVGVMTGGLVEEFEHAVLPSIRPVHTFLLTALFLLPILYRTWSPVSGKPSRTLCIESAVLCAWTAYNFGWHVHEKAILLIIPLLILLMFESEFHARLALLVLPIGHFSLFPLLFTSYECWIKYSLFASYTLATAHAVSLEFPALLSAPSRLLPPCVIGLAPLLLATDWLLPQLLAPRLPFLPLMLTSLYCAVCLAWAYCTLLARFLLPVGAAKQKTG